MMDDITVQELKKKKEAGESFLLLDVREPYERAAFHLGGAFEPMGNFPAAAEKYAPHKEDEVVVYCRSGSRSAYVQALLHQQGFQQVRNLEGGILAWIALYGDQGEEGP